MNLATVPKRVLVVEDDTDIREVLIQILLDAGYEVTGAANGSEALQSLRDSPEFGLIILDLMMPVMDGWQFSTQRSLEPALTNIPVVVLSASVHLDQHAAAIGAASYLKKPIQLETLLNTVARCYRSPSRAS